MDGVGNDNGSGWAWTPLTRHAQFKLLGLQCRSHLIRDNVVQQIRQAIADENNRGCFQVHYGPAQQDP